MMDRLLGLHTRVGELGLRLLQLHLLWVVWTLRGGVVLGAFPATAAVYAVVRRDVRGGRDDDDLRPPLRQEFGATWRQELAAANTLGYVVALLWAVLLLDRHLLAVVDLGAAGPVVAGLLWTVTAFAFVATAALPALQAHFAEGPLRLLRRSAVLVLARPRQAMLNALVVGAVLCGYYVVPGLAPVFGVALVALASTTSLWGSGLFGAPAAPVRPAAVDRTGDARGAAATPVNVSIPA
jgi:uncharacterized membrane protein YesL